MGRRSFSWHNARHSSMMESHLLLLFPGLALTNFSDRPPDLGNYYCPWPEIHVGGANAAPLTKSWLPTTTTRCAAPSGPPQLRLAIEARPESPARNRRFLRDPDDVLEAPSGMIEATHWWCLLEFSGPKKRPELKPSDETDPKLKLSCVGLGPNAPCSGLAVSYWVSGPYSYRRPSIAWECTVSDPFDSKRGAMEFGSMIHCGGTFYAISLQGAVAVIEVFDTRLRITAVGSTTRAVPTSRSRFFKEYLVEMKGEILLVYLIHYESVEVVDDVEIIRLDLIRLDWNKVERLRGKTMFLKESRCDWVESAEFGCRDNCVFFTEGKENNKWRVYNLKSRCISSVL